MSVTRIQWNLLFHDYKAVNPLCHIPHRFKNFKSFQIPNFLVESILQMNRNLPWCMSHGFCIWPELEPARFPRKPSNSSENVRVDIKDSHFHQWNSLKLILLDAGFFWNQSIELSQFLHFHNDHINHHATLLSLS